LLFNFFCRAGHKIEKAGCLFFWSNRRISDKFGPMNKSHFTVIFLRPINKRVAAVTFFPHFHHSNCPTSTYHLGMSYKFQEIVWTSVETQMWQRGLCHINWDLVRDMQERKYRTGSLKCRTTQRNYTDFASNVTASTCNTYKSYLNVFLKWAESEAFATEKYVDCVRDYLQTLAGEGNANIRGASMAIRHLFAINNLEITEKDLRDIKITQSTSQKSVNRERIRNKEFKIQAAALTGKKATEWLLMVKRDVDSGKSVTIDSVMHKKPLTIGSTRLMRYLVLTLLEMHFGIRAATLVTIPFEGLSFKERPTIQRDANDKEYCKHHKLNDLCLDLKLAGSFKNQHLLFTQGSNQSNNYFGCSCSHPVQHCWVHGYIAPWILELEQTFGPKSNIAHKLDHLEAYCEEEITKEVWEKEFKIITTWYLKDMKDVGGSYTSHMNKRTSNSIVQESRLAEQQSKEVNRHFAWSQSSSNILSFLYNGSSRANDLFVSKTIITSFFDNLKHHPNLHSLHPKRALDEAPLRRKKFKFIDFEDDATDLDSTEVVWEQSSLNLSQIVGSEPEEIDVDVSLIVEPITQVAKRVVDTVGVKGPVVDPNLSLVYGNLRHVLPKSQTTQIQNPKPLIPVNVIMPRKVPAPQPKNEEVILKTLHEMMKIQADTIKMLSNLMNK
jgi:hypothetical protein